VVQPESREQSVVADYTESVVPPGARRSNFRMFLTFGSMQLVFGAVLVGYSARFEGLTLGKLITAMAIATVTMTVYSIGSANVGAVAGQTHAVTTRNIFGTIGSAIVSLLVIDGMGFYLFTVLFVITLGQALLSTIAAVSVITALLAFVMIFNNYFGFTGLQRFAQFVAVPVVVVWGVYATIKAFTSVSAHALSAVPHTSAPVSIFFVTGGMVGLSTWGNEPDIFRYAKAGKASWWNVPTIAIPYALGAFIFPIMGYLIATLSDQPDFAPSIKYFATFTLFGVGGLMMIVLLVNQWAVQDGNLYIAINGAQNLLSRIPKWRREYTVIGLGLAAAGLTFILPSLTKTFNIVTGIGAVTVPVASTIMAMDVFVVRRLFGLRRPLHRVASWSELATANWPAIAALVAGTAVGVYRRPRPQHPGFGNTYIGFPALQVGDGRGRVPADRRGDRPQPRGEGSTWLPRWAATARCAGADGRRMTDDLTSSFGRHACWWPRRDRRRGRGSGGSWCRSDAGGRRGHGRERARAGLLGRADARPGRFARAHLRARQYRVGGLRRRDQGRRRRGDPHAGRHAAASVPSTVGLAALASLGGRGPVPRRCRILGRGDPRQPRRTRAAARCGRSRVQVLPIPLRGRRLPAGQPRPDGGCARDSPRPGFAAARPCRERAGRRRTGRGERGELRRIPGVAPAAAPDSRHLPGHRGAPPRRRRRGWCTSRLARAADDRVGPQGRRRADR
jgi:purine-cytosine permease-like protein